ncbi:hypothetical protein AOLI_G00302970 [Acnodon oligacanthus]
MAGCIILVKKATLRSATMPRLVMLAAALNPPARRPFPASAPQIRRALMLAASGGAGSCWIRKPADDETGQRLI